MTQSQRIVDVPREHAGALIRAHMEAPRNQPCVATGPFRVSEGPRPPFGDHLNAERLGGSREPCNTWADGDLAAICSKSALKNRLERMTGNASTCEYPGGIPLIEKMSTKNRSLFQRAGVQGIEAFIFSSNGHSGEWRCSFSRRIGR